MCEARVHGLVTPIPLITAPSAENLRSSSGSSKIVPLTGEISTLSSPADLQETTATEITEEVKLVNSFESALGQCIDDLESYATGDPSKAIESGKKVLAFLQDVGVGGIIRAHQADIAKARKAKEVAKFNALNAEILARSKEALAELNKTYNTFTRQSKPEEIAQFIEKLVQQSEIMHSLTPWMNAQQQDYYNVLHFQGRKNTEKDLQILRDYAHADKQALDRLMNTPAELSSVVKDWKEAFAYLQYLQNKAWYYRKSKEHQPLFLKAAQVADPYLMKAEMFSQVEKCLTESPKFMKNCFDIVQKCRVKGEEESKKNPEYYKGITRESFTSVIFAQEETADGLNASILADATHAYIAYVKDNQPPALSLSPCRNWLKDTIEEERKKLCDVLSNALKPVQMAWEGESYWTSRGSGFTDEINQLLTQTVAFMKKNIPQDQKENLADLEKWAAEMKSISPFAANFKPTIPAEIFLQPPV